MSGSPKPPRDADDPPPLDQALFDTITGPNLRRKDNLLQAYCILGGIGLGAIGGVIVQLVRGQRGGDLVGGALVGIFAGIILSLLLSGTVIGVVRGKQAAKRL